MNCMKCGRDLEEGQVFCELCLKDMEKYPVKPGIAIQLPNRKAPAAVKKTSSKRRQPSTLEEQILHLNHRLTRVLVLWFITLCLLAATIYPTVQFLLGKSMPRPGQNYTTITSIESK